MDGHHMNMIFTLRFRRASELGRILYSGLPRKAAVRGGCDSGPKGVPMSSYGGWTDVSVGYPVPEERDAHEAGKVPISGPLEESDFGFREGIQMKKTQSDIVGVVFPLLNPHNLCAGFDFFLGTRQ